MHDNMHTHREYYIHTTTTQAWVASQCTERQRQVSLACDRLAAEVKVAMDVAGDDGSMVDGSVTDLLSNLDDVMSVMSGYSQMTCGSTTAPA